MPYGSVSLKNSPQTRERDREPPFSFIHTFHIACGSARPPWGASTNQGLSASRKQSGMIIATRTFKYNNNNDICIVETLYHRIEH